MIRRHLLLALLGASAVILFASLLLGSTPMGPGRVLGGLVGSGPVGDSIVIWQIRFPRALAAFVVGMALGISGAALQGLLRNPLAEPGVLGVSAAASLTASVALYYGAAGAATLALPLAATLGALAATTLIAFAALRTSSVITLILFGVGLSSFAGAIMALLLNLAPNPHTLADMINWTMGSVANRSFEDVGFAALFMAPGFVLLLRTRPGLTALSLGEEAAGGLGVDLKKHRLITVLGAGLTTGGAVALAGAIGFVGLMAPHFVRPFVGHDPARTLIPAALLGGAIVSFADILVRIIPTQSELKLGVIAALIGAPAFVWIAMGRRGTHG